MLRHYVIAFAAALCFVSAAAATQQAAIAGIVADSGTGRPLENVSVTLDTGGPPVYRTSTDRNGFYQILRVNAGTYTFRSQRVGYQAHEERIALTVGEQRTLSVRLAPAAVELERIEVTAERGAAVSDLQRQVVTPTDLRMVPVPGGSGDLVSYLQTLPGVASTGDRGGQLFVRGGNPSDNMVLVDGIPIYQPFHILGFFSVFSEDLVSTADFYPGGFGARYQGRTSSVLDVRLREGNPQGFRSVASVSPFIAEGLAEGPAGRVTLLVSARRSLVEETSGTLLGETQPLTFDSQLFKVTTSYQSDRRCSALALRTADRGLVDPEDPESRIAWKNLLFGLRCVTLGSDGRLFEANWSYARASSEALSRGSSRLQSVVFRLQHDLHATGRISSIPVEAGYTIYIEPMRYDMAELIAGRTEGRGSVLGISAYIEPTLQVSPRFEVRPGIAVITSPRAGVEPRLRARWDPFGASKGSLQGALGLYRQYAVGISDVRDVNSVFVAWVEAPDGVPLEARQVMLGWQQPLFGGLRWSVEGYYKRMIGIPVTVWTAVAQFTAQLARANGEAVGADVRLEYTSPHLRAFLGYGYGWTRYEASQEEFPTWFGEPVQSYHPPHDRRHQLNALLSLDLGDFSASARWQFGSGLPFTRPIGFDEVFDVTKDLPAVRTSVGTTRLLLDRPFTGRLPLVHRLDVSLERAFHVSFGQIGVQVGVVNAYDRRNMFYYDLFTGRRVDQLPLAPYASLTLRTR